LENVKKINIIQSFLRGKKIKRKPTFLPGLRGTTVALLGSALESQWPRRGGRVLVKALWAFGNTPWGFENQHSASAGLTQQLRFSASSSQPPKRRDALRMHV